MLGTKEQNQIVQLRQFMRWLVVLIAAVGLFCVALCYVVLMESRKSADVAARDDHAFIWQQFAEQSVQIEELKAQDERIKNASASTQKLAAAVKKEQGRRIGKLSSLEASDALQNVRLDALENRNLELDRERRRGQQTQLNLRGRPK